MEDTSELSVEPTRVGRSAPSISTTDLSAVTNDRFAATRTFPTGEAMLMSRDIFFRDKTYVDDIVKDLHKMSTLRPAHRPSGIVLTTLNGNHSSPQCTLAVLVGLLENDAIRKFNYHIHDGPVNGETVNERYRSLMNAYPHHRSASPNFLIVPDYAGLLAVSETPCIDRKGVQEHDGILIPFQDDDKHTSFMVYNSYTPEQRSKVPTYSFLETPDGVPQRYVDFADRLSAEYLQLQPARMGLKLECGNLEDVDKPNVDLLTDLVIRAINNKDKAAHRVHIPTTSNYDELFKLMRRTGHDLFDRQNVFVFSLTDAKPSVATSDSLHGAGPLQEQQNNVTRFYSVDVAWYLKHL